MLKYSNCFFNYRILFYLRFTLFMNFYAICWPSQFLLIISYNQSDRFLPDVWIIPVYLYKALQPACYH